MPSLLHEIAVEMFRDRPNLAPRLLELASDIGLPTWTSATSVAADLSVPPTQALADAAVAVGRSAETDFGLVVEVQTSPDPKKELSWPMYVTVLRRRLGRPVDLIVFCPDHLATRYRKKIPFGVVTTSGLRAVVVPYGQIPKITDPGLATDMPELAVLSAATHGGDPKHGPEILRLAHKAIDGLPPDQEKRYRQYIQLRLGGEGKESVMTLFKHNILDYDDLDPWTRGIAEAGRDRGLKEGIQQGREQGHEQGLAVAVLDVLSARGLDVDDQTRERITTCHDLDRLQRWLTKAVTVGRASDLFT